MMLQLYFEKMPHPRGVRPGETHETDYLPRGVMAQSIWVIPQASWRDMTFFS